MGEKETKFISLLKSINIYGMPFSIRYKNKSTYVSGIGIFLSLISIIMIFTLFLYYFLQLINHTSFTILSSNDKRKEHSIDLSNIPIMLGLIDKKSRLSEINQDLLGVSVWKKNLSPINKSYGNVTYTRIEVENCNESIYKNKYPEMKKYDLSKYICIKSNQKIKINGRYGDSINGFDSVNIHFSICITEECLNKTNNLKDLDNILYGSYFSIHYLSQSIDHYNYKQPLFEKFRSENFEVTPFAHKKFIYFYSSMTYISNNGILFDNKKKYTSFIFDHLHLDFVGRNNSDSMEYYDGKEYSTIIELIFSSADYPIVYNRNYLKITEIFSNIGGLIDFIFIVCNAITIYFSRKSLIADISNNLVFNGDNKNENERKISKFVIFNDSSKINFGNTSNKELIYSENRKFNINVNDIKHIPNNEQIINNKKQVITKHDLLNNNNSFYIKYLKNSNLKNLHSQKLKISFLDYFLPYFILKKYKNYELLCVYHNIMHSYLSLEQLLPSIERCRKLFQSGNPFLTKINENNIFSFRKINLEKNNFFSIISTNPNHLN